MKKETSSIFKKQQIYTVEVTNNDNTLFRKTSLHISPKATTERTILRKYSRKSKKKQ